MRAIQVFVCVVAVLVSGLSHGADAVALLKTFVETTESASGEFLQKALDEKGNPSAEQSSGRFAFARPGKFLWETCEPFPQVVVSDAKTLWIYDPDLKQVTVRTLQANVAGSPAALLFGKADLEAAFQLLALPDKEGLSWVKATPKKADAAYVALEVGLDERGVPQQMRVLDTFGMTNLYIFKRMTVPSDMKESVYDFQIPRDADVLRDRSAE